MFRLQQRLDEKVKQEINEHFVHQSKELNEENSQQLNKAMLCDFENVQRQEPRFMLEQLFPNIQKWNLTSFKLIPVKNIKYKLKPKYRQEEINIFRLISHIDFTSLQYLHLNSFQLHTIEPLSHMKFQKLQTISIQSNNITSLQPLSKVYLPNLNNFRCQYNPYIDEEYKYFPRMYLKCKKQYHVILDIIPEGHGIYFSIKKHLFKVDTLSAQIFLIQYSHNQFDSKLAETMARKSNLLTN